MCHCSTETQAEGTMKDRPLTVPQPRCTHPELTASRSLRHETHSKGRGHTPSYTPHVETPVTLSQEDEWRLADNVEPGLPDDPARARPCVGGGDGDAVCLCVLYFPQTLGTFAFSRLVAFF
ncbi:hypothetical protein DPEC_G00292160 [Dallia pectoralis]|uniref:Uncharacterized protein n=1 Tax=Dallia pectoralis TaxID=75939 RepID=A0ACC2FI26_DALPE|nr:hypothetical protein DPEC_G00292160 [Dallia pectoralis]